MIAMYMRIHINIKIGSPPMHGTLTLPPHPTFKAKKIYYSCLGWRVFSYHLQKVHWCGVKHVSIVDVCLQKSIKLMRIISFQAKDENPKCCSWNWWECKKKKEEREERERIVAANQ